MTGPDALVPLAFDGQSIRVEVDESGKAWLCARDVGASLCMTRTAVVKAVEHLDEDEKGVNSIHTLGGPQEMLFVSVSGAIDMTLGSRKPEAKRFRRWLRKEVVPEIMETGSYNAPEKKTREELLADALLLAHEVIAETESRAVKFEALAESRRPGDELAKRLTSSGLALSLTDAARVAGITRATLIDTCMTELGWLWRRKAKPGKLGALTAYASQSESGTGRFVHVPWDNEKKAGVQVKITFKGLRDALGHMGRAVDEQMRLQFEEKATANP